MREELKNFDWYCYGLQLSDLNYTITLVDELIKIRDDQIQNMVNKIEVYEANSGKIDKEHDGVKEAVDDFRYYHYLDNLNIFHFGLWRLQGIFEGILKQKILEDKAYCGLKKILDKVINRGYIIEMEIYTEIL